MSIQPIRPSAPLPEVAPNTSTMDIIASGQVEAFMNFAKIMAHAGALPQGVQGNAANLLYLVMAGIDAGFRPMQALELYDMIQGKPALSAEGKRVAALRDGHDIELVDETDEACTVRGRRKGKQTWHQASYSIGEARKAGLVKPGSNWEKHPADMLFARATARLIRRYFPDVASGVATLEDLVDATPVGPSLADVAAQRTTPATAAEPPPDEAEQRAQVEAIAAEFTQQPDEQDVAGDGVTVEDPPADLWPAPAEPGKGMAR